MTAGTLINDGNDDNDDDAGRLITLARPTPKRERYRGSVDGRYAEAELRQHLVISFAQILILGLG